MDNILPFNLYTSQKFTNFMDCISEISDPRLERGKLHSLVNIIFVITFGILGGANNASSIGRFGKLHIAWFRLVLDMPNGIPSHDTINRALKFINPDELHFWLNLWREEHVEKNDPKHIAIDGKEDNANQFYCSRAFDVENNSVIAYAPIPKNGNEISAATELLNKLNLNGKIVTGDAIITQTKNCSYIVNHGGDYQLALKKNQRQIFEDVKLYFDHLESNELLNGTYERSETLDKGHGRIEHRVCLSTGKLDWLYRKKRWKKLRSIVMIKTTTTKKSKTRTSIRYFISSLSPDSKRSMMLARSHWAIENQCHRTLDVNFDSDRSTFKDKFASLNMSIFKDFATSILKNYDTEQPIEQKRLNSAYQIDSMIETLLFAGI